jgi:RHS repeat-associated protein
MAEQNATGWSTPYKFTGKELDDITGLYYFGARYYDPRISLWMSVDPMAEKYPGWSAYRYGFNNPISYIDQFGLFESKADAKAYAKKHGIKTGLFSRNKIVNNLDYWSIANKKEHSSISDLGGNLGIKKGVLIGGRGLHPIDIGMEGLTDLNDPHSENYNPNAVIYQDWYDIIYELGSIFSMVSPTLKACTSGKTLVNGAAKGVDKVKYIGRLEDLKGIPRSQTLLDDLPNLGSPKANYYQNMSVLRKAIRDGYTIKDASWFRPNSELAPTLLRPNRTVGQSFLGAERLLLKNRGLWP